MQIRLRQVRPGSRRTLFTGVAIALVVPLLGTLPPSGAEAAGPAYTATITTTEHGIPHIVARSEEHTSELQSLMRSSYAALSLKKHRNTTQSSADITKQQL